MVEGVYVEGLQAVVRDLQRLGATVEDLKEVFGDIAADAAETVADEAPVKSGALRGSVRGNRAKNKAVVAAGYAARVPYAGPINYGWPARNIPADGFMQRADAIIAPRALDKLDTELDRLIDRLGLS
jgi:hypothetical protein